MFHSQYTFRIIILHFFYRFVINFIFTIRSLSAFCTCSNVNRYLDDNYLKILYLVLYSFYQDIRCKIIKKIEKNVF